MNFYKITTIALAGSTAATVAYAIHLEGGIQEKNKLLLQASELIKYLTATAVKHEVPFDEFDVMAINNITSKR